MEAGDAAKKRILVVDDEPDVVTYLVTLLQDHGYITDSAGDGEGAMAKVKAQRPDLIMLDISMPRQSGIRFYRELNETPELADIKVLVVTGVTGFGGSPDDFKKFLSSRKQVRPPDGFLPKPVTPDDVISAVGNLL